MNADSGLGNGRCSLKEPLQTNNNTHLIQLTLNLNLKILQIIIQLSVDV